MGGKVLPLLVSVLLTIAACDGDPDKGRTDAVEPVAVLTCETTCAGVQEAVVFSAEGSFEPSGKELDYEFHFGDGAQAFGSQVAEHAYALPGAYQVELIVTNEAGLFDHSACIVSVGTFPTETGTLDSIAFAPNYYDPRIIEPRPRPYHGGMIWGFFNAPFDANIDRVLINGIEAIAENCIVDWCDIVDPDIEAGEPGILRCHSYNEGYDIGDEITIAVKDGETTVWSTEATLPEPSITPSYITPSFDGKSILVHARNDWEGGLFVEGLSIDGTDVTDFAVIHNPDLAPGGTAIIEVPRCDGISYGEWMVFTVHGRGASGPVSDSRALRLFPQVFPVGNWSSGDRPFEDDAWRAHELSVGINMFIYNPLGNNPYKDPAVVFPLAEAEDFYLFTHLGWPDPAWQAEWEAVIAEWGDHPRWLTNAASGEGESDTDPLRAQDNIRKLQYYREQFGARKPTWVYNHCSYHFPSWGAMADISGFDRYCVWAAKCNVTWPIGYWDEIWALAYHAEVMKRAAEPGPMWTWTQSMWNTFDIAEIQIRCTTAEEIRSQWYILISRGTKGMLWFVFRESWEDECPCESTAEMARLATELRQIDDILVDGDVATAGTVVSTDSEDVDVSAIMAPKGIVIVVTNFDYELKLIAPWVWHARSDVIVDFTPGEDFEVGDIFRIDHDTKVPLDWERIGEGHYQITLPELYVAEAILVEPEP